MSDGTEEIPSGFGFVNFILNANTIDFKMIAECIHGSFLDVIKSHLIT